MRYLPSYSQGLAQFLARGLCSVSMFNMLIHLTFVCLSWVATALWWNWKLVECFGFPNSIYQLGNFDDVNKLN